MIAVAALFIFVASALGDKGVPSPYRAPASPGYPAPTPSYAPSYKPKQSGYKYEEPVYDDKDVAYQYGYNVQDAYYGTAFSKQEHRNGVVLEGEYKVALPDSTIQIVRYRADPVKGFVADVSYEGTPVYPEYKPNKKSYAEPSYQAAPAYKAKAPVAYKEPETGYRTASSQSRARYAPAPTSSRYAAAVKARTYQA